MGKTILLNCCNFYSYLQIDNVIGLMDYLKPFHSYVMDTVFNAMEKYLTLSEPSCTETSVYSNIVAFVE